MGVVWRGEDQVLGRDVAVKRLGMTSGPDALSGARAEREARLAARVAHSHVVAVYDLIDEGDEQWLVMEYVDGATLGQVVHDRGPLDLDTAARLLAQAADALAAAHAAGIVHRDVKPSNILIDPFGQVKLTDFGIARGATDATLTEAGSMSGSPAYLAPEVASGHDAGPASDVWALGATLYHAITGSPPYDGRNAVATLFRIVHEDPPRPADAGWLRPVLEATMTHDPADRWTMTQVRDFLTSRGGPAPADARPAPSRSARRALVRALATVAAVVVVAGVGVGATLLGRDQAPAPGAAATRSVEHQSPDPLADPTAPMRAFVRDYLSTVTSDPAAAWRMLTPAFQADSGGFASYQGFWSTIAVAHPTLITADPASGTVGYTVRYTKDTGFTFTDHVVLHLSRSGDRYLIAAEE
jgi:hypothetical protein